MRHKKTFTRFITTLIVGATVATLGTPVLANASPGIRDGGVTGGSNDNFGGPSVKGRWHFYKSAPEGNGATAWDTFVRSVTSDDRTATPAQRDANAEQQILRKGADPNVCRESRIIAWVTPASTRRADGSPVQNPNAVIGAFPWTNSPNDFGGIRTSSSMVNNITTAVPKAGSAMMTNEDIQRYRKWDREENGARFFESPGYTILCSWWKRDEGKTRTYETVQRDSNLGNTHLGSLVAGATSFTTIVSPQLLRSVGGVTVDPIGLPNLHTQASNIKKTSFGVMMDQVVSGARAPQIAAMVSPNPSIMAPAIAAFAAEAAARIAADQTMPRATVQLSPLNKMGLQEGGILNVQESAQFASFLDPTSSAGGTRVPLKQTTITRCKITENFDEETKRWVQVSRDCRKQLSAEPASVIAGTNIAVINWESNFFQLMSVHCNNEVANLTTADPALRVMSQDSTKGGSLNTVLMTRQYAGGRPRHLDFGDSTNPDSAKARTASVGYFDRECAFDCMPMGVPRARLMSITDTPNVASNDFKFFRDNEWRNIDVTRWIPVVSPDVNVATGLLPLTTTVNRWSAGTPGTQNASGGRFEMRTLAGRQLFTGADQVKTQKNFSLNMFSNSNTTILPGMASSFRVRSSWASDATRPQVINIKWEYAPLVSSTTFDSLGFGAPAGRRTVTGQTATQFPIQGKCYANFGSLQQYNTVADFANYTGTGSQNGLDNGSPLEGTLFNSAMQPHRYNTNLVIAFLRATSN